MDSKDTPATEDSHHTKSDFELELASNQIRNQGDRQPDELQRMLSEAYQGAAKAPPTTNPSWSDVMAEKPVKTEIESDTLIATRSAEKKHIDSLAEGAKSPVSGS
jgi:hypothetical protein